MGLHADDDFSVAGRAFDELGFLRNADDLDFATNNSPAGPELEQPLSPRGVGSGAVTEDAMADNNAPKAGIGIILGGILVLWAAFFILTVANWAVRRPCRATVDSRPSRQAPQPLYP